MRWPDAYVPLAARKYYTPQQWRWVIRDGMRYRRARRFSPTFTHRNLLGHVIAVEINEWMDLGGEGGL